MVIFVTGTNREAYRVAFPQCRTRVRSDHLTHGLLSPPTLNRHMLLV